MGLAGKVRDSLETALKLDGKHAEAHTALALYHAEIIGKIGALIGGMTYGAKASEAEKHIAAALKLTPDSPIAHVEYGNLLLLLYGDRKEDAAASAFEKAAKLSKMDQNAFARWVIGELDSEKRWDKAFSKSGKALAHLADQALEEHTKGKTRPLHSHRS